MPRIRMLAGKSTELGLLRVCILLTMCADKAVVPVVPLLSLAPYSKRCMCILPTKCADKAVVSAVLLLSLRLRHPH